MVGHFSYALLSATALAGAAQAQPAADDAEAMRARIEALESRLAQLEGVAAQAAPAGAAAPAAPAAPATEIRFSGAPRISSGGWSFKPRGRIQYDAGHVGSPDGIVSPALGFANRLRRGRLGVEGAVPGGFGYRFEVDFAGGTAITDAFLTYRASPRVGITLGQHNHFQGLERMTSSNFTSFMERAGFTNAFNFERRVGLSAAYSHGPLIVQGGVFTDDIPSLDDRNSSVGVSGRIVYAPRIGETQLHLAGSAHHRGLEGFANAGATQRYRHRPALRTHDTRFVATPALLVEAESHYGLEAALIRGPFHAAAEVHWLDADLRAPGASPSLFGGYVEAGWFLTGESRGYRGGAFDRTRVRRSVEEGGFGAVQLNLRYDYLDLNSGPVRGGVQNGILASIVWIPTDHVRFMVNYGRLEYDDAAIPAAGGRRSYGVDVIGARAQIDF